MINSRCLLVPTLHTKTLTPRTVRSEIPIYQSSLAKLLRYSSKARCSYGECWCQELPEQRGLHLMMKSLARFSSRLGAHHLAHKPDQLVKVPLLRALGSQSAASHEDSNTYRWAALVGLTGALMASTVMPQRYIYSNLG